MTNHLVIRETHSGSLLVNNRYFLHNSDSEGWYFEDSEKDFSQSQLFEEKELALAAMRKDEIKWETN